MSQPTQNGRIRDFSRFDGQDYAQHFRCVGAGVFALLLERCPALDFWLKQKVRERAVILR